MTKQHPNAYAYVIYEKATFWRKDEKPEAPWRRTRIFYAEDATFSRDQMWEREIGWRDPRNIRVVPLYDEDGNDAMRDANLDAIAERYQEETAREDKTTSLASAVETALETNLPMERFEGLLRTLQAFETQIQDQLEVPPNTVTRADYLPSVEQLEALKQFDKG